MASIASISILVFLIPGILIFTLAAFFIYKFIYDKHTNKVLESGETKRRKWIAPWGLALIVFGAQLILALGIIIPFSLFMVDTSSNEIVLSENSDRPIDLVCSEAVSFVVEDNNYEKIGEEFNDDIEVNIFKKQIDDGIEHYIFVGTVNKKEADNVMVSVTYRGGTDYNYDATTWLPSSPDASSVNFKCEIIAGDTPSDVQIGVVYGDQSKSMDEQDQAIKVKLN